LKRDDFTRIKRIEGNRLKSNLKDLFDLDFRIKTYKYFNIAYRSKEYQIKRIEEYINFFYNEIYSRYFIYEMRKAINIVYFRDRREFRKKTGTDYYGFYGPEINTFFTYTGSGHGTLWHELMHAFINNNSPIRPQQWFDEGLASFYEMSFIKNKKVSEGYTNWRLPSLQKAIGKKKVISLKKMITGNRFTDNNGYAQARHFFCYLWIHNKMITFVRKYLYELLPKYDNKSIGLEAVKLIEKLFKKNIDDIDNDFQTVVLRFRTDQKLVRKITGSDR
jgi:hypothetical protein